MGFKKNIIERVIKSYTEIRNVIDSWFQFTMKTVSLSEVVGGAEECPRVCDRQKNRENYPAESAAQYWKRTVAMPLLAIDLSLHSMVVLSGVLRY